MCAADQLGDCLFYFFIVSLIYVLYLVISEEEAVVEASVPLCTSAEEAHGEKTHPMSALPSGRGAFAVPVPVPCVLAVVCVCLRLVSFVTLLLCTISTA